MEAETAFFSWLSLKTIAPELSVTLFPAGYIEIRFNREFYLANKARCGAYLAKLAQRADQRGLRKQWWRRAEEGGLRIWPAKPA
jgi:hypothetical protein